ncbi:recombination protein F [Pseudomonas sp. THAF187a]|uniref:AAA family ATPase n=1 Tax=unclassified Pseudomonas TaxID=196821 RepID=UPI001268C0EB|nr:MULTISPECIES: AAA family ATPase [unclassified Pseudomonas]QFT24156.1 recombination protein F [Pseudomonas sp. THAF187a]QFT44343.1 recombination protein F [Pseudomonas sp. THAF42]
MKSNIKKLTLENFKAFHFYEFKINSNNLTVLDGPNGFGKTSFFDAVELLLTGNITRYASLEADTVDGRSTVKGSPLTYDLSLPGTEVSISAEVETGNGIFHLRRSAIKADLDEGKGLGLNLFKLYISSNNGEWQEVANEAQILEKILGPGYKQNYRLFHYVEQENNTAALKSKGSTKQKKIDHLFDVGDYREKCNKIAAIKNAISKLKTAAKKEALELHKNELSELRQSVSNNTLNAEDIVYERLISATLQPWDLETIDTKPSIISSWLEADGVLNKLKKFRQNAVIFFNSKHNNSIDKSLRPKLQAIESLLRFGGQLDGIADSRKEVMRYDFAKSLTSKLENSLHQPLNLNFEINSDIFNEFNFGLDYKEFISAAASVRSIAESADLVELAYNELLSSRDTFITKFSNTHLKHNSSDCPACGYEWGTRENLLRQLDLHRISLEALVESNGKNLKNSVDEFKTKIASPILKILEHYIATHYHTIEYKRKLIALSEEQISYLQRLKYSYTSYRIDLSRFYCKDFSLEETLKIKELEDEVRLLYREVNYDSIEEYFQEFFEQIFLSDEKSVMQLDIEAINRKHSYLKLAYIRGTHIEIASKEAEVLKLDETYRKAVYLSKALEKLVEIYTDNLSSYISSVAKGIEVLFHVYSGRLLQNFQNGLGIFIETDGKSLSFREHPNKLHDAIFSMSSGQLSSLVLSFTLALNKRYAKNSILLIDDPAQSLDDINVAGFIDLLRNEFSERQIILSTHEDEISSYMKYKFKKHNLEAESIDFKRTLHV